MISAIHTLALAQGDVVALTMMALLGFAMGMILTIVIVMARHAGRSSDTAAELAIAEEDDAATRTKAGEPPPPPRDDWEREADWWKH